MLYWGMIWAARNLTAAHTVKLDFRCFPARRNLRVFGFFPVLTASQRTRTMCAHHRMPSTGCHQRMEHSRVKERDAR